MVALACVLTGIPNSCSWGRFHVDFSPYCGRKLTLNWKCFQSCRVSLPHYHLSSTATKVKDFLLEQNKQNRYILEDITSHNSQLLGQMSKVTRDELNKGLQDLYVENINGCYEEMKRIGRWWSKFWMLSWICTSCSWNVCCVAAERRGSLQTWSNDNDIKLAKYGEVTKSLPWECMRVQQYTETRRSGEVLV